MSMQNIGQLTLKKGDLNGLKVIMWDAVPECTEFCDIFDSCPDQRPATQCRMRRKYIANVIESLDAGITEKDEVVMMKIGLLIIPLFTQLISFKLHAHSLSDVMFGNKVHPVFREIRSTIADINKILRDLEILPSERKAIIDGNSNYYDDMIANGKG